MNKIKKQSREECQRNVIYSDNINEQVPWIRNWSKYMLIWESVVVLIPCNGRMQNRYCSSPACTYQSLSSCKGELWWFFTSFSSRSSSPTLCSKVVFGVSFKMPQAISCISNIQIYFLTKLGKQIIYLYTGLSYHPPCKKLWIDVISFLQLTCDRG